MLIIELVVIKRVIINLRKVSNCYLGHDFEYYYLRQIPF